MFANHPLFTSRPRHFIRNDRFRRVVWSIFALGFLASIAPAHVDAQDRLLQRRLASGLKPDPDVPASALLTDRGRQLADRLSQLKRSYAAMGPRHPSKRTIEEEMALVKEQLKAWSANADSSTADGERSEPLAKALPEMNETDLRQLILRLVVKVELLEQRVLELETRTDK